jgi:hypothetical protein
MDKLITTIDSNTADVTTTVESSIADVTTAIKTEIYMRGPQGIQGIQGIQGERGNSIIDIYSLSHTEGNDYTETTVNVVTDDETYNLQLYAKNGVDGVDGVDGAKGDKGDKGDTGEQGIQGDKGDTGPQGVKGDKGDKGDKGNDGMGVIKFAIENGDLICYAQLSVESTDYAIVDGNLVLNLK